MKKKSCVSQALCLLAVCALFTSGAAIAQTEDFSNWPARLSPKDVGKQLAEHFVTSPHEYGSTIHYSEVATWYGALQYATITHEDALRAELIKRFQPLLPGGAEAARVPMKHHVDDSIFGVVPLEIAIETGDQSYLAMGRGFADRQWEHPTADGMSDESRFWIDDMYMLTILQLEAYRATHNRQYLDRAALEMTTYLDKLQQANGLFFHSPESQFYWGRGDGWVAAGMAADLDRSSRRSSAARAYPGRLQNHDGGAVTVSGK